VAALQATYQRQLTGFERLQAGSVAVNEVSGDVFVADSIEGSGNIQEYDPLGVHLATWNGSNTPSGSFSGTVAVALNEATGEVYVTDRGNGVVDVFDSEGKYLSQFNGAGTPAKSFGSLGPAAAAIDQVSGDVYVPDPANNVIDVFNASGAYIRQIFVKTLGGVESSRGVSIAVDGLTEDMFVAETARNSSGLVYKYDLTGKLLQTWSGANTPVGFGVLVTVAVDEATGDVLVGTSTEEQQEIAPSVIDVFDPAGDYLSPQITGTPKGPFPKGSYQRGMFGIAVDAATGQIYVGKEGEVDVFSSTVLPGVIPTDPSSRQADGTALTLGGEVNPDGVKVSACKFEYGTEAGIYPNTAECARTAQIGEGESAVPVGPEVSGLQPDTQYHFRLVATNANGTNIGEDETFFTSTAPQIAGESSSSVGSDEAALGAQIGAAGLMTTYRVEYGPAAEPGFGSSTTDAGLGNAESSMPVTVQLSGLQPNTEYHFRFAATNSLGTTYGAPVVFRTFASSGASSSALPDARFYELVTRSGEDSDAYAPTNNASGRETLETYRMVAASENGNTLAYIADPAPGGNGAAGNGFGNQFLGTRSPGGAWYSRVISPTGLKINSGAYQGFSSDLSVGVASSPPDQPITSEASLNCNTFYSYTAGDDSFQALFTKTRNPEETCNGPAYAGASADGSHIAFEMPTALTPEAPGAEEADLYDSSGGQLNVVNISPEGIPVANAAFGSPAETFKSRVVSKDGSRMFWTDLNNHDLYVREDNGTPQAKTALVAEGGEYATANSEGTLAFFTKAGDLYSFDLTDGQTSDLAHGGEVQGVVGASEDGAYVYFVGKGALKGPAGETLHDSQGEAPQTGDENLYVSHEGSVQFIVRLAEGDNADWQRSVWEEGFGGTGADVFTTAEVAPGGHGLVFESSLNLTGYDSHGTSEVYIYETNAGKVYCASCSPTGLLPVAGGGMLSLPTGHAQLPRWISADASKVFFESAEPLVPQETSGKTEVYEWEREGTGGCQRGEGCLHLLSVGAVGQESIFLDASASGDNVFFATRAQLLSEDQSDNTVIYDARVGTKPVTPPACTGTGCQGVPPAPPIFATPSSVTFNGVGNFEAPVIAPSKTKSKPKTGKCKRGYVKKKGKCTRKVKSKRAGKSGNRSKRGSK